MKTRSWLLAGLPGLALVVFHPFLMEGRVISSQDIARVYLPIASVVQEAVLTGDFSRVIWNPDLGAGFPLAADGATTPFYPPQWLLLLALSPARALTAGLLLGYAASALAMAALARSLGASTSASAIAGLGYGLCGFAVGHAVHVNIVAGLPFLPLVLLCAERATLASPLRHATWAGLLWGAQCLGGHPQIAVLTAAVGAAFAMWRFRMRGVPPGGLRAGLRFVAVFAGVGLGIAAVYYLPMAELAGQSVRPGSGFGQAPATTYSLPAVHLVTSLSPFFFFDASGGYVGAWNPAEMSLYPGVVVLLFAGVALATRWRAKEVRFFTLVGGLALVLALGNATPVHTVVHALPVLNALRAPARYVLLLDLSLCLLAAIGWDALRASSAAHRRRTMGAALAAAALVLALSWVDPTSVATLESDRWPDAAGSPIPPLWPVRQWLPAIWLLLAAGLIASWSRWPPRAATALGVALVALDHGAFAATALGPLWVPPTAQGARVVPHSGKAPDAGRVYLIENGEPWRGASNRAVVEGFRGLNLYVSLPLRRHAEFLQAFWLSDQSSPRILQAAGVTRVVDAWQRPLLPLARIEDVEFSPRWPIGIAGSGQRLHYDLRDVTADGLELVTALRDGSAMAQGTVAATVRLIPPQGEPLGFDLRAGIETSARLRNATTPHQRPSASLAAWSRVDGSSDGIFTLTRLRWPDARPFVALEVEYGDHAGALLLFGATLRGNGAAISVTPFMAPPYRPLGEESGRMVYELTGARPRASAVHQVVRVSSGAEAVRRLVEGGDTAGTVGLEDPQAPEPSGPGPSRATLVVDEPLRTEVAAEMNGSGYVVLADTYAQGWKAEVDGSAAPIYIADGLFRAVFVPDGAHHIVFRYEPASLRVGLAMTLGTLAAAALLLGLTTRRGR